MQPRIVRRVFSPAVLALLALLLALAADARGVSISWVPVGNPGNPADFNFGGSGPFFGAVNYSYSIDKYDVTVSQYVEFLNAKDPSGANTLGLYNSNMSNASDYGGVNFNAGNALGSKYGVIPVDANHPINNVSWYDAIRFANWLNNGQGNGDTETGAYTLLGGTPTPGNGPSITRNAGVTVFLPNENEWFKAAYYDPRTPAQGGPPLSSHNYLLAVSNHEQHGSARDRSNRDS
jgi:sulfatase modifying factor 1